MINKDRNLFLMHGGNVTAVTSGIGSMGKTWFASTLAHALNIRQKSVLLFDADNSLANISLQLGISPDVTLNDILSGDACFNQALYSLGRKKFDFISATTGSEILQDTPDGRLQILREELLITAQNYDHVIADMPLSEKIITHFMPRNVNLILICTNDPSNLVSTYQFLHEAAKLYHYKNLQLVINYANSYEEGMQTYNTLRRACEQYIKTAPQLLGVVRRDTRVRDAIRNKVLLLNRYPDSEAAEDIMSIADKFIQQKGITSDEI